MAGTVLKSRVAYPDPTSLWFAVICTGILSGNSFEENCGGEFWLYSEAGVVYLWVYL